MENRMVSEEKIVIIGTGFIGGYLRTGLKCLLGEDLRGKVFGIKGRREGLQKRQEELPDYILSVCDTEEVLRRETPSIIMLSAPPDVSAEIAGRILKPYYEELRSRRAPLPDLHSFPPSPSADWYEKLLGSDLSVAKILPNIYPVCAGVDITPIGVNTVTLAGAWPRERFSVLERMLSPYGTTVALTDSQSLVFLAGKITSHVCCEVCYTLRDAALAAGLPVSLNGLGSALRYYARQDCTPSLPLLVPCSENDIPEQLRPFVRGVTRAWFEGLTAFTRSRNLPLPDGLISDLDARAFALNIFGIAYESEAQLREDTKNAATKGGVLERGIEYFYAHVEEELAAAVGVAARGETVPEAWFSWLSRQSQALSRAAYERSCHLAKSC